MFLHVHSKKTYDLQCPGQGFVSENIHVASSLLSSLEAIVDMTPNHFESDFG